MFNNNVFNLFDKDFEFIVLRKSLFEINDEGGFLKYWKSNYKKNNTLIPICIYMELNYNRGGIVATTLSGLVEFCKLEINTRKYESVWKMRELLIFMETIGLINLNNVDIMDTKKFTKDTLLYIKYNKIDFKRDNPERYAKIPITAIKKILTYDNDIITYWCYLETMKWDKNDLTDNSIAPVLIRSYDKIKEVMCVKGDKIKEYNDLLLKDELLLYATDGTYKDKKGNIKEYCNIYITLDYMDNRLTINDYKRWLKDGINQHINYMKDKYEAKTITKPQIYTKEKLESIKNIHDKYIKLFG